MSIGISGISWLTVVLNPLLGYWYGMVWDKHSDEMLITLCHMLIDIQSLSFRVTRCLNLRLVLSELSESIQTHQKSRISNTPQTHGILGALDKM